MPVRSELCQSDFLNGLCSSIDLQYAICSVKDENDMDMMSDEKRPENVASGQLKYKVEIGH
jgi:hypothetical protein